MKTINTLKKTLKNQDTLKQTLRSIILEGQRHYLEFLTSNLVLEYITFIEVIGEEETKKLIEKDLRLKEIINSVQEIMSEPEKWLNASLDNKEAVFKQLGIFREDLSDQVAVLAGYDDQVKQYEYILRRKFPEAKVIEKDVTVDQLVMEIMSYIYEYEDSMTINNRIKTVYGQLPVRMSKIKLHEWIEQALMGLKGIYKRDLDNYLAYLEETYAPETIKGYGLVMKSVYESINTFETLFENHVEELEISQLSEGMERIKSLLEACVSLYTYTVTVINNIMGMITCVSEESYEQEKETLEEFMETIKYIYNRRHEEHIVDAYLVKRLDTLSADFEDQRMDNKKWDALFNEIKEGYTDEIVELKLSEALDGLLTIHILISSSYFAPLETTLEDLSVVDMPMLMNAIESFIKRLDAISQQDGRWQKRARIANLLSVLIKYQRSPGEIEDYIRETFENCRDQKEKMGSLAAIRSLMVD